jgi:GT2 family glycosyltransferase
LTVSVVIVAFNSGPALSRCLDSLRVERDRGTALEAIVVNNGQGGAEIEEAHEREFVRVLEPGRNLGYAAASNLGAEAATGEILLFLNPDTVVVAGALDELVRTLAEEGVEMAMPRLLLLDDPSKLNSSGCAIHIAGLGWSSGFGRPAATLTTDREITYANGSVLAIPRDRFSELGGFTPELFVYHEDLELGWRGRMRGWRVVINPRADVMHEYAHGRNPTKNYFMERNRLIFVTTAYSGRMLLVLAPLLVTAELGLSAVALREGWFRDKVRGWAWCLSNARWIREHRRALQGARTLPDRCLAPFLTPVVDPAMIEVPRVITALNPLLRAYWSLARRLL